MKHLKLKKLKCVIIPPDLDKIQSEGIYIHLHSHSLAEGVSSSL